MGSLSILQILLIVFAGLALWLTVWLLRPNKLLRFFSRMAEGRHFVRVDRPPPNVSVTALSPRFLIVSAILGVLSAAPAIAIFMVPHTREYAAALSVWLAMSAAGLGFIQTIALVAAAIMHFRPNSNRSAKYALLLFAVGIVPTLIVLKVVGNGFEPRPYLGGDLQIAFEGNAVIVMGFLALQPALWIAAYDALFKRWYRGASESRSATGFRRSFRIMRKTSTGAILAASISLLYPISLGLLIWRYYLVEAARRRPIVFLRSFSHAATVTVFGAVISKIASRYGIIVAIVHATQRGSDLFARTDAVNLAATVTVADDAWQLWVTAQLQRASAVIIDRSHDTEGVRWEIARAMENVPAARIALLSGAEQPPMPVEAFQLQYSLDREGVRRAREALDAWFQRLVSIERRSAAPRESPIPTPQAGELLVSTAAASFDSADDRDRGRKGV